MWTRSFKLCLKIRSSGLTLVSFFVTDQIFQRHNSIGKINLNIIFSEFHTKCASHACNLNDQNLYVWEREAEKEIDREMVCFLLIMLFLSNVHTFFVINYWYKNTHTIYVWFQKSCDVLKLYFASSSFTPQSSTYNIGFSVSVCRGKKQTMSCSRDCSKEVIFWRENKKY